VAKIPKSLILLMKQNCNHFFCLHFFTIGKFGNARLRSAITGIGGLHGGTRLQHKITKLHKSFQINEYFDGDYARRLRYSLIRAAVWAASAGL
jgi:hypothetical protein